MNDEWTQRTGSDVSQTYQVGSWRKVGKGRGKCEKRFEMKISFWFNMKANELFGHKLESEASQNYQVVWRRKAKNICEYYFRRNKLGVGWWRM